VKEGSINNFEYRILYTQDSYVDESIKVKSNVCAISYTFAGAMSPITVRCRLTVVYSDSSAPDLIDTKGGTIEKWTDRGWLTVDEYFDAFIAFESPEEALDYLLNMFKSFLLGAPMNVTTVTNPEPVPPTNPEKVPNIRVLSFAKEKAKSNDNPKTKKTDKSDKPDFDWI